MLNRDTVFYDGTFELGRIPYSRGSHNNCGFNLVKVYLHLTWMPETRNRRGYWCLEGIPQIMCPGGSTDTLITGMKVFDLIEQNDWRKYIKEKNLYDELYSMREWMNNYSYRGTPTQERVLERARAEGLLVPGNEREYLRSIQGDVVRYVGIGYTREYHGDSYTYGTDLLVKIIPSAVEQTLEEIFKIPSVYRKLSNVKMLQNTAAHKYW